MTTFPSDQASKRAALAPTLSRKRDGEPGRSRPRLLLVVLASALVAVVLPSLAQDPWAAQLFQQRRAEVARAAAPALAKWIETSRHQAIAEGVKPIPAAVQRRLAGYFPDSILERVRYRVGLRQAATLPAAAFEYGHAIAMTLGDIIVFRDSHRAETDASLWAHELQHVLQFDAWGVTRFAQTYLANWEAVETEARTTASEFDIWEEVEKAKGRR